MCVCVFVRACVAVKKKNVYKYVYKYVSMKPLLRERARSRYRGFMEVAYT